MRAYHQYEVLHIIAIMDRVYHQIEAEGVLYTASAVTIYKHFVLDDMPNLATLRFGYKKISENVPRFFWRAIGGSNL